MATPWIDDILQEGELYAVGGSVRDALMGRPSADQDYLVSGIEPARLEALLASRGKVHLVGKHFGIFVFKPEGSETHFDVALPRREQSTGPGHKDFEVQVDAGLPVEEDLRRRDFTINAMARRVRDGALVDPWGGQADLVNKLIRQVFPDTFREDPLRLLRACQFAARFGFKVEAATLEGMKRDAALVSHVSPERVLAEIMKLLKADKPSVGFNLMRDTGLLREVLPELQACVGVPQPPQFHAHPVYEHIMAVLDATDPANIPVRWAALCHDLGKPPTRGVHPKDGRITFFGHQEISEELARKLLLRLRAPNELIEKVGILCREHMFNSEDKLSDKALRRLIARVGVEHIEDLIAVRRADNIGGGMNRGGDEWEKLQVRVRETLTGGGAFTKKDLKINGADLMKEMGIRQGPDLGRLIDRLFEAVLEDPSINEREKLLQLAKKLRG
ncbi:MAG: CCA tRNA nucleotidyltransferase [Planctomycetota bacterium]